MMKIKKELILPFHDDKNLGDNLILLSRNVDLGILIFISVYIYFVSRSRRELRPPQNAPGFLFCYYSALISRFLVFFSHFTSGISVFLVFFF